MESTTTTMDTVMDRLTSEGFKAAIQSLSPKLRSTYELHVLGLSGVAIAERLGISHSALRKRLHDARKHLRAHLGLDPDQAEGEDERNE